MPYDTELEPCRSAAARAAAALSCARKWIRFVGTCAVVPTKVVQLTVRTRSSRRSGTKVPGW